MLWLFAANKYVYIEGIITASNNNHVKWNNSKNVKTVVYLNPVSYAYYSVEERAATGCWENRKYRRISTDIRSSLFFIS